MSSTPEGSCDRNREEETWVEEEEFNLNESENPITPLWLFGDLISKSYGFVIELSIISASDNKEDISV